VSQGTVASAEASRPALPRTSAHAGRCRSTVPRAEKAKSVSPLAIAPISPMAVDYTASRAGDASVLTVTSLRTCRYAGGPRPARSPRDNGDISMTASVRSRPHSSVAEKFVLNDVVMKNQVGGWTKCRRAMLRSDAHQPRMRASQMGATRTTVRLFVAGRELLCSGFATSPPKSAQMSLWSDELSLLDEVCSRAMLF
jgi:hypothetical protein